MLKMIQKLNALKKHKKGIANKIINWVLVGLIFVTLLPTIVSELTVTNLSSGAQSLLNQLPLFMVIGVVFYIVKQSGAGKGK